MQISASGVISGPDDRVAQWVPAISAANAIYADPSFWALVSERSWIRSGAGDVIAGSDVASALRAVRPADQTYTFRHFGWGYLRLFRGGTNASTSCCAGAGAGCGAIHLNVKDADPLPLLVNTIAHENTHVVGRALRDGTTCHCTDHAFAFADTPNHPLDVEVWMVSYGLGDLAQCFYENQGDRAKTLECFDTTVDGSPKNRTAIECSSKSHLPTDVLRRLRHDAHVCGS